MSCERGEAAVVQFHGHAFQGGQRRRDLQKLQDDLGLRPKDLAGGQPCQHGIGHLARRSGHRHAN